MKITLPIFHTTDESEQKKLCGKDYSLENDCEKREVTFYNINAISIYKEDNFKCHTTIHANSSEYICALSIGKVEEMIDEVLGKNN